MFDSEGADFPNQSTGALVSSFLLWFERRQPEQTISQSPYETWERFPQNLNQHCSSCTLPIYCGSKLQHSCTFQTRQE